VKRNPSLIFSCLAALALGLPPVAALAQEATSSVVVAAPVEPKAQPSKKIGVNVDLEVSSVYVFRGLNVFKNKAQTDQTGALFPSLTYTVPGVGFHIGYWGAYQMAGPSKGALVAAGSGNEQDVVVGVTRDLGHGVTLDGSLTWYLYPFAKKSVAGTTMPTYLEPSVTVTWSGPIDLELKVLYFAGVQQAVKDWRYLYLRPRIGKTFTFNKWVGLATSLAFGYKVFNDRAKMTDNVYDIRFDWALPINVTDQFYVTPAVHVAWTNLKGVDSGDEFVVFGGMNVGVNF
jgi:hypothetical protein